MTKEESVLYEQLYQERIGLKKEVAMQTTEKRISLESLLKSIEVYEDLAKNNVTIYSFLKQMQKDFSLLLSKVFALK